MPQLGQLDGLKCWRVILGDSGRFQSVYLGQESIVESAVAQWRRRVRTSWTWEEHGRVTREQCRGETPDWSGTAAPLPRDLRAIPL